MEHLTPNRFIRFEFGGIGMFSKLAEQAGNSNNKYTVNCIFMQK